MLREQVGHEKDDTYHYGKIVYNELRFSDCIYFLFQDGYQLALELEKAWNKSTQPESPIDVVSCLKRYGGIYS